MNTFIAFLPPTFTTIVLATLFGWADWWTAMTLVCSLGLLRRSIEWRP